MATFSRIPNPNLVAAGMTDFADRPLVVPDLQAEITDQTQQVIDGFWNSSSIQSLDVGKLDSGSINVDTFIQSTNYVAGTSGWYIDGSGNAQFNNITLTGGNISYGKTSFADSAKAGYWISPSGFYFGSAADATYIKYDIGAGTLAVSLIAASLDGTSTIGGRTGTALAAAINASSNLITDVINARLDTSARAFLLDFNFGATNYAGAVNAGTVTWNATTGAITGGSGVILYRGGILGVAAGVTTFFIDPATGNVTLSGQVTANSGAIAAFTVASTTLSATNLVLTSGAANAANIAVGTGANLAGMNSANSGTDIAFWAGATFANRAAAPFRVNAQGDVTMTSATITGLTHSYVYTSGTPTWTKPAGATFVRVICIGAGGGGGGSSGGGNTAIAGGSGGGGGAKTEKLFLASDLPSSLTVTVGTGGSGGTGNSSSTPSNGIAGGNSSFSTFLYAYGGGGGAGSQNGTNITEVSAGGSGGGSAGAGNSGSQNHSGTAITTLGGLPASVAGANGISGQGGGSASGVATLNAEYGGGGGGGSSAASCLGGSSLYGGGGGGGGPFNGGTVANGGKSGAYVSGGGGAGGADSSTANAGNGSAGADGNSLICGSGGGAGGYQTKTSGSFTGGNGGNGGALGGGGGGGGGSYSGSGGSGGAGGNGGVYVYAW